MRSPGIRFRNAGKIAKSEYYRSVQKRVCKRRRLYNPLESHVIPVSSSAHRNEHVQLRSPAHRAGAAGPLVLRHSAKTSSASANLPRASTARQTPKSTKRLTLDTKTKTNVIIFACFALCTRHAWCHQSKAQKQTVFKIAVLNCWSKMVFSPSSYNLAGVYPRKLSSCPGRRAWNWRS